MAAGGHGVPAPSRASGDRMAAAPSLGEVPQARRWGRQARARLPTSPSGFLLWLGSREPGLSQPNPEASFQNTLGARPGPTRRPLQEEELRGKGGLGRVEGTGPLLTPDAEPGCHRSGAGRGPGRHANTSHPRMGPGRRPQSALGSPAARLCPTWGCLLPLVGLTRTLAGPRRGLGLEVPPGSLQGGHRDPWRPQRPRIRVPATRQHGLFRMGTAPSCEVRGRRSRFCSFPQRLLGRRFGNNKYQILPKYVTAGLAQLRATPSARPAPTPGRRPPSSTRRKATAKSSAVCASPQEARGRSRPGGQARWLQGAAPSRTGEAAPEGPALSWPDTARTTLSLSVLLGLSTPRARPGPPTHPPCTRKARARPTQSRPRRKEGPPPGQAGEALGCRQPQGRTSPQQPVLEVDGSLHCALHMRGRSPVHLCGGRAPVHLWGGRAPGSTRPLLSSPSCCIGRTEARRGQPCRRTQGHGKNPA